MKSQFYHKNLIKLLYISTVLSLSTSLSTPVYAKAPVENSVVNVKDFGAIPDDNKDDTKAIQAALDYAGRGVGKRRVRSGVVELGSGYYNVTRLTLPSYVHLKGNGIRATFIGALPFKPKARFNGDREYGLIEIAEGPVQNSGVSDLTLFGNTQFSGNLQPTNSKQWGLYLRSKWGKNTNQGGLWWSHFDNINIEAFNHLIWSRGGYSTRHSLLPNQFNSYRNINGVSAAKKGDAVRFTGQHGQQMLENFSINSHGHIGYKNSKTRLVYIGTDPAPIAVEKRFGELSSDKAGKKGATRAPGDMVFRLPTLQGAYLGMYVEHAGPINLVGGHLEELQNSVSAFGNAKMIMNGVVFSNAGDGGAVLTVRSGAQVTGQGNTFAGRYTRMAKTYKPWKFQLEDSIVTKENGIPTLNVHKHLNMDGRTKAMVNVKSYIKTIHNAPDHFVLYTDKAFMLSKGGNIKITENTKVNAGDELSFSRIGNQYRVTRTSLN